TNEETTVLRNALSNLQMVYVEVSQQVSKGGAQPKPSAPEPPPRPETATPTEEQPPISPSTPPAEGESKKKFTKSYGSGIEKKRCFHLPRQNSRRILPRVIMYI